MCAADLVGIKIRARINRAKNTPYVRTLSMKKETERIIMMGKVIGARNTARRW
jgi:hypothetical protein